MATPNRASSSSGDGRRAMNADLRVVTDEQFPFALHYFTGSKEHNVAMRGRAQARGLKLNEYELAGAEPQYPAGTRPTFSRRSDLAYIPPELREHTGEMEAAEQQRVAHSDRGRATSRACSTATRPTATATTPLEEMAEAAEGTGPEIPRHRPTIRSR